jgi:hypothetical protein
MLEHMHQENWVHVNETRLGKYTALSLPHIYIHIHTHNIYITYVYVYILIHTHTLIGIFLMRNVLEEKCFRFQILQHLYILNEIP